MTEKLLDHRERNAAQGELHPLGVPQRMAMRPRCGDTADSGETPQQKVHELFGSAVAVCVERTAAHAAGA